MTRHTALSGVALASLMLAAAPAHAQLLSLDGNDDATVSVDLGGGGSGGGGGLLNLGDDDDDVSGDVSVNDESIIDIDGDGDGDLLDLNGDGIGDREIELDLFGPGEDGETQVAVGADDDGGDDVLLTLFGRGGGSDTASINVLPGGTGSVGGIGGGSDTSGDVNLDLFGDGDGNTDPTETGSTDGGGGTGGSGAGGAGGIPPMLTDGTQVAALGNAGAADCFTPNGEQIAHLLARGSYSAAVTTQWGAASDVNLVAVNLCPDAEAQVAAAISADPNAASMQRAVAANAMILAELRPSYTARDVLAVDQSGNQLTVYVY